MVGGTMRTRWIPSGVLWHVKALRVASFAVVLGCGDTEVPQCPLPTSHRFVQVETIGELNVARREDGRIACWGYDTSGACAVNFSGDALYPVMSKDVRCLTSLHVNGSASGGLDAWGYPMLWGNQMGELFNDDDIDIHPQVAPIPLPLLDLSVEWSGVAVVDLMGRVYWRGVSHVNDNFGEGRNESVQGIELPDPARRV